MITENFNNLSSIILLIGSDIPSLPIILFVSSEITHVLIIQRILSHS